MSDEDDDITDDCELDVHVLNAEGKPAYWEKVTVFWGFWYGHESKHTDRDGHARFWIPDAVLSDDRATSVEIHVAGEVHNYDDVECGDGYTIQLSD